MENDIYRNPLDRRTFPPRTSFCYQQTSDSEKAIEYFTKYLELAPERPDAVQVKWLLNLAYMTLGKYPAGVPHKYLISPSVFASREDFRKFADVAPAAGLNFTSMAGGVVVDDFENNGLLDVVVSSYDVCQPLRFFHGNGDGTFTDHTAQAGLSGQLGGLNMVQTDYNNDGCKDILVLRGGWEVPQRNSLLRNNCDATFTDVTAASGLAKPATSTQTAAWACTALSAIRFCRNCRASGSRELSSSLPGWPGARPFLRQSTNNAALLPHSATRRKRGDCLPSWENPPARTARQPA